MQRNVLSWRARAIAVAAMAMTGCGDPAPPDPAGVECSGEQGSGWCWQNPVPVPRQYAAVTFADASLGLAGGEGGRLIRTTDGGTTWQRQESGTSSDIVLVRIAGPRLAFAVTAGSAVLRSEDAGATWVPRQALPLASVTALQVFGPTQLLAQGRRAGSLDSRTLLSIDAGASWSESSQAIIAVSPDGAALGRSAGGLALSRDLGQSFSQVISCAAPTCAAGPAVFFDESRALAFTYGLDGLGQKTTLWRHASNDGGRTWTSASVGPRLDFRTFELTYLGVSGTAWLFTPRMTSFLSPYPPGPPGVWRSVDGGSTWQAAADLPGELLPGLPTVWNDRTATHTASTVNGARRTLVTTDAGTSWQALQLPPAETASPDRLLGHAGGVLTVGYGTPDVGRWYASADAGAHWKALPGARTARDPAFAAPWFHDGQRGLLLAGDGTLRMTSDGGLTWQARQLPGSPAFFKGFSATRDGALWIAGSQSLYRSLDAGATWQPMAAPSPAESPRSVQFVDAKGGYASTYRCRPDGTLMVCTFPLYRTVDGGTTWEERSRGPDCEACWSFADRNVGLYTATTGEIRRTTDGGITWSTVGQSAAGSNRSVLFTDETTAWLLPRSAGNLMRSRDAGLTWTAHALPAGLTSVSAIHFADADHGWLVSGRAIAATTDGGETWALQRTDTSQSLTGVFALDANHAWVTGQNGTVLATRTGGR